MTNSAALLLRNHNDMALDEKKKSTKSHQVGILVGDRGNL